MDDPNEEFIFYLEAIQCKLEGNKTISKTVVATEVQKKPVMNTPVERVTTSNICSIIMTYLFEQAKSKAGDHVISGDLQNIKDFDIFKKKDQADFSSQFDKCLKILEEEGILIPTGQADVFSFNRPIFDKMSQNLYQRLKNEDEMEFGFDKIYAICNQIVSQNCPNIISKELVYRVVNDLYKSNYLYKADKNSEKYGVS
jgi:hypothetical protein